MPVDYVVKAMDHIAHRDGLDGRAFHLTDPNALTAGQVIDTFAQAAHAPQSTLRLPAGATEMLEPLLRSLVNNAPFGNAITDAVLADFGVPRSVLIYVNWPTKFDSRADPGRAQGESGSRSRRCVRTPASSGTTGSGISTQTSTATETLVGAARGRLGLVGGSSQILEQQVPDELMRVARRVRGNVSLEQSVRGRIVMVTGASSGIGKAAAMKIADAGGTVLLVARTPEKLEATKDQIEAMGGIAYVHPCDLSDFEDIDRMAEEVLDQHGHVDVLVNNAGRSIRRSIALSYDRPHDFERTIQLNYLGAVRLILKLLPVMRERKSGQIINVSSIGVQTNMPRFSAYVASKSALDAFSRCIASEIVDDNVAITTINMPLVRTPMIAPTKMYDRFPTITPDEAGDMLCEAIIHKPKRIATPMGTLGQIMYALNPKSIDYILNTAYHLFPDSAAAKGDKEKAKVAGQPAPQPTRGRRTSRLRSPTSCAACTGSRAGIACCHEPEAPIKRRTRACGGESCRRRAKEPAGGEPVPRPFAAHSG